MAVLHVLHLRLHRHEDDVGIVALDHEVGGIREQLVIGVLADVRRRGAGLAHRHPDQLAAAVQALALEHVLRQRLGLEQQGGVGGDDHLAVDADVLEHLAGAALAHRHHRGALQPLLDQALHGRVAQRARADRVDHHRHAVLVGQHDLAQEDLRLAVEQDAAAAEDQEIEASHLGQHLVARQRAHRHHPLDLVALAGVVGIAREHRDLDLAGPPAVA